MSAADDTVEAGRQLYKARHGTHKPKPTVVPAAPDRPGDRGTGDLAEGAALYKRTQTHHTGAVRRPDKAAPA